MAWWNRKPAVVQAGSVLFRGRWAARPEDFGGLAARGVRMGPAERREDGAWRAPLSHHAWGRGELWVLRDPPTPPAMLVSMDPRLTDGERAEVESCRYAVLVSAEPRTGNVLSDRKDLLRFLHAVLGPEGVAAVDHAAQAFWSRQALEDELAHDADLDIDGVYTLHLVGPGEGEGRREGWLHSHGLGEMGFWDFDVVDPSGDLGGAGHDLVRAVAFAVVEERLSRGGEPFELAEGHWVRAVAAREFLAQASPAAHPFYRRCVDEEHREGHSVLCEPAEAGGLLARLLRRAPVRASRFLSEPLPEEGLIRYSDEATELMARRARQSVGQLRAVAEELAELEPVPLVKLRYEVDGGRGAEHLWFQVHAFRGDAVEAVLLNAPFRIARLKQGDRAVHPLERLSDWVLMTPVGRIDPRQTRTLRQIRESWDRIRALLAEQRGAKERAR